MKKKFTLMLVLFSLIVGGYANPIEVFAITETPAIVAETAILIDAKTGTILYNKEIDAQREPASTTKMITGLLALEKLPLDKVVTIDAETPFTGGSRIYLLEGEEITVEDLLYAMFLESANDAAAALAIEMAGSLEDFAVMMNEKAKELGAKNTNFVNPHGLHAEGHMTTSYDLAMIAKACMENEVFRKYVTTYQYTIQPTNKQAEPRYLYNTNRLLYDTKTKVSANGVLRPAKYEGVTGIKTGYTGSAGGCLAASALKDGTELIAVNLKSTDKGRFGDAIALLDWGFENYHSVKTVSKNDAVGTIKVTGGKEKEANLVADEDGYVTLPIDMEADKLTKVVKIAEKVAAPIEKGQVVGSVDFFQGDILMGSVDLVAEKDIAKGGFFALFSGNDSKGSAGTTGDGGTTKAEVTKGPSKLLIGAGIFAALLAAAVISLLIIRYRNIQRRKKRRAERAMKLAMEREMDKLYYNREKMMNR